MNNSSLHAFHDSLTNRNHHLEPLLTVADFNGDGAVNISDFGKIATHLNSSWGEDNYHYIYDRNVDLRIDFQDLILTALDLGKTVPLLDQQIARATQATLRYYGANGIQNAIADGYIPSTPEAQGHGQHFFNFNLALQAGNSETLDIEHPIGLNFDDTGKLVAVFYTRIPKTGQPTPENPFAFLQVDPADDHPPATSFDTLSAEDWHHHHSAYARGLGNLNAENIYFEEDVPLSMVVSRLQDSGFQIFPNSDAYYLPKLWMLHGWFHSPNPDGVFANTHPEIAPYAVTELGVHGEQHGSEDFQLIRGTDGAETLTGTAEAERLNGFDGNDRILAKQGDDFVWGGFGDDTLHGDRGNDMVYGGPGNDQLYGDRGNDRLFGGTGNDQLWGGKDDDLLRGGLGDDSLTGDSPAERHQGRDRFVLAPNEGKDIITDFQIPFDQIVLVEGITKSSLSMTQQGSDTLINWLNNQNNQSSLALLQGINSADLMNHGNFIEA